MTPEPLTHDDMAAYLLALKTKQPTAESSAALRKILQKAMRAADSACPPEQLLLFGETPKPKRVMLNTQAELF